MKLLAKVERSYSLLLQGGHADPQDSLVLGRQRLLNVLDHPPQQVGAQLLVQLSNLGGRNRPE